MHSTVTHAQISADRAIKVAFKHREHVGGGTTNIHGHNIHTMLFGQQLQGATYRQRSRQYGCGYSLIHLGIAGSLGHDMVQKHLLYGQSRRV
ncbi:hypothetical protein SDC9_176961 [bioreactor metagenome]|uniref:Uncharacterized protein n=1 Tax=bioreactor metagenome TaxID=1076179 RepID=A0A645GRM8_9ZZZZ